MSVVIKNSYLFHPFEPQCNQFKAPSELNDLYTISEILTACRAMHLTFSRLETLFHSNIASIKSVMIYNSQANMEFDNQH